MLPIALLTLGCIKPAEIPRAAAPTAVAVAAVMEYLDSEKVEAAPEAMSETVSELLAARNLPPTLLDAGAVGADWSTVRNSAQRLGQLPAAAGDAELVLLVESHAEYYSQLSGQYRWTVDVRASLAPVDDLGAAIVEEFEIPVFLFNYNQREREALEAAAPVLERKLGAMLDQVVGGL